MSLQCGKCYRVMRHDRRRRLPQSEIVQMCLMKEMPSAESELLHTGVCDAGMRDESSLQNLKREIRV